MSEVACEPELPPELMMSGMNSASTTRPLDLVLEVPHGGGREHLAEEQRHSQPARLRIIAQKPIWVYGSSSASMPPNFCTSSVCSATSASITSSTVTMPRMWPAWSTTGQRQQVVLRDEARDVLAVHVRVDRDQFARAADLGHQLAAVAQDQLPERYHAPEPAVIGVDDIHLVDRLLGPTHPLDQPQRLFDGPGRRHAQELRGHDAAGLLGRILQEELQGLLSAPVEGRQQPRALAFRQLSEQHGLLVARHGIEQRARRAGIQRPNDRHPVGQPGIVEHLNGEVERQGRDHSGGGRRGEVPQGLGDVGRLHASNDLRELGRIAGQQIQELGVGGHESSRGSLKAMRKNRIP